MGKKSLCSLVTNLLGISHLRRPPGGQPGRETRPHLSDDEGVVTPTTRKEVSHGSVYHASTPRPNPSPPEPAGSPARVGARGRPPQGHHLANPQGGRRPLEVDPLHPLGDLLDLLLASAQPRSLLPVRSEAAGRLDGAPRSPARRRRHQSVLQGPGAATGIGAAPPDAAGGLEVAPTGPRGV